MYMFMHMCFLNPKKRKLDVLLSGAPCISKHVHIYGPTSMSTSASASASTSTPTSTYKFTSLHLHARQHLFL